MIYLLLFLTFLKIGAVSFGGGYAMIPLIQESVVSYGWMTEEEILNFIAVAESTPGPIAVNMATFVGSSQGGILGAFLATLGVVLPSFIIILLIATLIKNLLKFAGVKAFLDGLRPAVIGLIVSAFVTMFLTQMFAIDTVWSGVVVDYKAALVFVLIAALAFAYKKWRKKAISPILLIVVSGMLGVLLYGGV